MNGPTNIDDPSHPFSGLGAGLSEMRQKRQDFETRQRMLAQLLAQQPGPSVAGTAPPQQQGGAPIADTGNASAMNALTTGLGGLLKLAQRQGGPGEYGSGPIAGGGWFAKDGGMKGTG